VRAAVSVSHVLHSAVNISSTTRVHGKIDSRTAKSEVRVRGGHRCAWRSGSGHLHVPDLGFVKMACAWPAGHPLLPKGCCELGIFIAAVS
jgi:hypothetical protein